MFQVPQEYVDAAGGEAAFAAAVEDFAQALAAHALTVDVPAPISEPIIEHIVRVHGGAYTITPTQPEPEPEPVDDLPAYAAMRRWQKETAGIMVNSVPVATDDRSKMMLMGARLAAQADPDFTTQWKTPAGFVTLDAATFIALSDAVLAHVDACFATEAAVLDDIAAGVITTAEQIDNAFA